jgi:hypothetical protein
VLVRVTLVGGPEDGRELDVPADRVDDLPPQINVAAQPEPLTARDFRAEPDALEPSRLIVHVYRREAQRLGPLSRVCYVFEGTW